MYPNLYYLFLDLFGIKIPFLQAVNSFGFFVAISFIVALAVIGREFKRKEESGIIPVRHYKKMVGLPATSGEIISNAVLGFILGYKLVFAFMHSDVFGNFPSFLFSSEGNSIGGIIGAGLLGYWRYYEAKKAQLHPPQEKEFTFHAQDHLGNILMLAIVFGFLGAKLFAYLEDPQPLSEFLADPFRGLTMYGGLICAAIAITIYFKKKNIPVLHGYDSAAPALMIAYGIGRIGCHVSGDGDWGIVNTHPKPSWLSWLPDWMWAYNYPNNVNSEGVPIPGCVYEEKYCNVLEHAVYPTPFYEFLMCTVLFFILWYFRKKISIPGVLFMIYLSFNGVERFLIESIRVNSKYHFFGIASTQAQLISLSFILIAILGSVYLIQRHKKKHHAAL